jgi:hypothetical protein
MRNGQKVMTLSQYVVANLIVLIHDDSEAEGYKVDSTQSKTTFIFITIPEGIDNASSIRYFILACGYWWLP